MARRLSLSSARASSWRRASLRTRETSAARGMGVGSRRLDIDTKWLKEYGVIAAKDFLTLDQFYKYENQSEEKIYKIREPGAAVARKLLGT